MAKFDDFDLDVKVNKGNGVKPQIFSMVACTPGTCHDGCHGDSTMYSNCCEAAANITTIAATITNVF